MSITTMGDQTQAYDIFQTPLSSGYSLPLSFLCLVRCLLLITVHVKHTVTYKVSPSEAMHLADQFIITMFGHICYCDLGLITGHCS